MAAVYYVDTSASGKRYIVETGSAWLQGILDPKTGREVIINRITTVEIMAAITRRERGGSLTQSDALQAKSDFRADVSNEYQVVEISPTLATLAMHFAETHGLRGYDAVQLAAAIEVNALRIALGMPEIIFVSADKELNAAAISEGLTVDDPNAHP